MAKKLPLISIVGPTASGKTKLALSLAKDILASNTAAGVDLISADSRQVYRAFEILSGADLGDFLDMGLIWEKDPARLDPNFRPASEFAPLPSSSASNPNSVSTSVWTNPDQLPLYPFLTTIDHRLTLHGAAIIDLKSEWSLGHFFNLANRLLVTARTTNRQVIIVGGTMLYHDKLLGQNELVAIPRDDVFRAEIESWTLEQLQAELQNLAPLIWTELNHSDRHNPRRLARKLEIAHWRHSHPAPASRAATDLPEHQYLIPDFDLEDLKIKIQKRVEWRFKAGAVEEVKRALTIIGSERSDLALPIGFNEIEQYLSGEQTSSAAVELWSLHEWQYLKRQLTWWRQKGLVT